VQQRFKVNFLEYSEKEIGMSLKCILSFDAPTITFLSLETSSLYLRSYLIRIITTTESYQYGKATVFLYVCAKNKN
jgi:hypothetical protein